MTLIITVIAAVISSFIWYISDAAKKLHLSIMCYMFWGASIMWFVDAIFEYKELRQEYFKKLLVSAFDDAFLGLMIITISLCVWLAVIFIKDPFEKIRKKI